MPGRIRSCLYSSLSPFFFFYSSPFPFNPFPQLLTCFLILYSIFWELALPSPIPSCASPFPTKSFPDTYPLTIASRGLPFSFIKPHVVPPSSFFFMNLPSFFWVLSNLFCLNSLIKWTNTSSNTFWAILILHLPLGCWMTPSFFFGNSVSVTLSCVRVFPNYGHSLSFHFS